MNFSETLYNDLDPSCERTAASLLIYSETLSPEELEARIGTPPTNILRKGRTTFLPTGRIRVDKLNGFFLESEEFVDSRDLRRHIDWLLERIGGRVESFHSLWRRGEVFGSIQCIWWSAHGEGGPILRVDQLEAIAELDLELSFGFAYYGPKAGGR